VTALFPAIEPSLRGHLEAGFGNHVYWEECGNPTGHAAVVLHGGPGSGCSASMRRFFDPTAYRVVLFDQRGCGRSTPHASQPTADLSVNTTEHLLADMEQLRQERGIERWLVFGVSWGVTLGLAYAERHPDRVTGMVLVGVTTSRRVETDWLYRGVAPLFPEEWSRFRSAVPGADGDADLIAEYYRLLHDPDPAVQAKAATDWTDWDWATASVDAKAERPARWRDPAFQLARARICTHYFHHDAWLEDGELLRDASRLGHIPGILINGRLDLQAPLVTAWELSHAWPGSELVVVEGAGHSTDDRGMDQAIVAATDRLAVGV
jgi:proline iminopeptidase